MESSKLIPNENIKDIYSKYSNNSTEKQKIKLKNYKPINKSKMTPKTSQRNTFSSPSYTISSLSRFDMTTYERFKGNPQ
jgi:hypothetical protein